MHKIKFLSSSTEAKSLANWRRQLADQTPIIGNCEFIFDINARDYDWLAVYDRFPSVSGERFSLWKEELSCSPENTIFITVEPSSIKSYEPIFLNQFGHVLTAHEVWSIDHPGVIRSQPALRWFYGCGGEKIKTLDEMINERPIIKSSLISTVCSSKQQKHTLHHKRYDFTQKLKSYIPELDIFGHGVKPMLDKAEAIDPYRYHIAIENHQCDHHWTEKVSDVFLGWGLPFYYGCTNLKDYFPEDSFIEIDINDLDKSIDIIRHAISNNAYEKRLTAITESRRRILHEYNLFAVLAKLAEGENRPEPHKPAINTILSRHALRKASLFNSLRYGFQSLKRRCRSKNQ
jgi:hypothetical protein